MHSSLCTPAGTTQLCVCSKTPSASAILSASSLLGRDFKRKRFLIPTEEHEQLHLLLKGISLGLGRRTSTPREEWNIKLIQRRISLHLNWHNQPKIHCFNIRKWQIKQEHTHPQNLVLSFCWVFPLSLEHSPSISGYPVLFYTLISQSYSTSESLVLSQKWEASNNSFPVLCTEPTLIKLTEVEAISSTVFTLGSSYHHIKFCSNLIILIPSFLNLVWT